ncbi:MAG: methionyl-tRNA formyltransferase, partial [Pseudomonadota bacterium]|nr:methionyl-tRNA formyltransferase [Pseudomonadota bacterium]
RGRKLSPNEVKRYSQDCSLEIFQPTSLKTDSVEKTISEINPHVLVVVAYGVIIPKQILAIPTYGGINVHASILPRWRGAAPIERAIMAGDSSTGISIMQMEAGLDTGPIYCTARLENIDQLSVTEIEQSLSLLGSNKLIDTLTEYELHSFSGKSKPVAVPQDSSLATYAHKITSRERNLDWKEAALSLTLKTRALAYRLPVAVKVNDLFIQILESQALTDSGQGASPGTITKIDRTGIYIQCGYGTLQITRLKLNRGQGKAMNIPEFLNGYQNLLTIGQELNPSSKI